jgi:acetyltransferase
MTGYPDGYEEELDVGGVRVTIRPIRADDLSAEIRFVHDLSPDTAYRRFFSPMHELSPEMAKRFTEVDYHKTMAFVALERAPIARDGAGGPSVDGSESIVGVARYATRADEEPCEFAVTIADRWQHRGLGRQLMQRLIAYARAQGLRVMVGSVMHDNMGMRGLAHGLGFTAHTDPGDPSTLSVRLDLTGEAPAPSA